MKFAIEISFVLFAAVCVCGSVRAESSWISLKVASSNIRSSARERNPLDNWAARRDDLGNLICTIKPDIIGFQELTSKRRNFFASKLEGYRFVGDFRLSDRVSGEGCAIGYDAKRFAMIKTETFWLSKTPEVPGSRSWGDAAPVSGYPRICTWALFRDLETDGVFCFANTHLDLIAACRCEGMKLIVKRLEKFVKNGIPVMLTGDMNANELEKTSVEARKVFNDSAMTVKRSCKGPWRTYTGFNFIPAELEPAASKAFGYSPKERNSNAHKFGARIDYIYATKNIKVNGFAVRNDARPKVNRYCSDHHPVEADLTLPVKRLSAEKIEKILKDR